MYIVEQVEREKLEWVMRAYSVNVKGSTNKLIESKGLSGGGTNDTPFRIYQYK